MIILFHHSIPYFRGSLVGNIVFIENNDERFQYQEQKGEIVLALIIMNEVISACRFLEVEGSFMRFSTVLGANVLALNIRNQATSACRFLKVEGYFMHKFLINSNFLSYFSRLSISTSSHGTVLYIYLRCHSPRFVSRVQPIANRIFLCRKQEIKEQVLTHVARKEELFTG